MSSPLIGRFGATTNASTGNFVESLSWGADLVTIRNDEVLAMAKSIDARCVDSDTNRHSESGASGL